MYRYCIKRILDIIFSFIAIILLSPIMLLIALLVHLKLGNPVIFKQKRPGKDEKIFLMYKFRSMTDAKDNNGNPLADEIRITNFGKKLRSSSLDELPELFNILRGDMSIVGPRPQLVRDMVFMTPDQRKRHTVLPGLTGLAQVNGRNNLSWEDKINYDLEYIRHLSFSTDCVIICKTLYKVIKRSDITTEGMDTAEDLGDYMLRNSMVDNETYIKNQKLAIYLQKKK